MDLVSHVSTCSKCYAPAGRFCSEANRMRVDEDSDFFVEGLINIPHRADREAYMAKYCKNYFDFPALKIAISEKYQAAKAAKQARA